MQTGLSAKCRTTLFFFDLLLFKLSRFTSLIVFNILNQSIKVERYDCFETDFSAISIALVTMLPQSRDDTSPQPPDCFTTSYTPSSFAISSLSWFDIFERLLTVSTLLITASNCYNNILTTKKKIIQKKRKSSKLQFSKTFLFILLIP